MHIDLNCDVGEGFEADAELMKYITSANIACGAHAGNASVMDQTVRLAKDHHVCVGAHPGYFDLQGFGRRHMDVSPKEIYQLVVYQLGSLQAFCKIHQINMQHVKPHGALYNLAAANKAAAAAIAQAVYDVNPNLILFGLAGSMLLDAGKHNGLLVASEAFADRTYLPDGTLTPRNQPNALIENKQDAVKQALQIIEHGTVQSANGMIVQMKADTICLHGDGIHAAEFARHLRTELKCAGIEIRALRE